jgi:hypothetical protein
MSILRPHCDCGKRVRVLWNGPISEDSRPVLLVCGYHPERCGFRQEIPKSDVTIVETNRENRSQE